MAMTIFLGLLAACLLVFAIFSLVETRSRLSQEAAKGVDSLRTRRQRLNQLTSAFVALGAEPMLKKAVSTVNDPELEKLRGTTAARYREIKAAYTALSFGYNYVAGAIKQAESLLAEGGLKVRKAAQQADQPVLVKEVPVTAFTNRYALPPHTPTPPLYQQPWLLEACHVLRDHIANQLKAIKEAPAQVATRLEAADRALSAAGENNAALIVEGVTYAPYESQVASIELLKGQIEAQVDCDPLGALASCQDLDRQIAALGKELTQTAQLLEGLKKSAGETETAREWVAKVRKTQITCPWFDVGETEPVCWSLATTDSNPDPLLEQSETLTERAGQSLASGNFQNASAERKQADAAREQAIKLVKGLFEQKNTIDEQVPRVRAELTTLNGEVEATSGQGEMSKLVIRACGAVEDRLTEIRQLYMQQKFGEALTLLTGTQGNEHGMPISKLLAQAKELCRLLKQATEVAGSVEAQLAR